MGSLSLRKWRVEHRCGAETAVLGYLDYAFAHHAELTPFVGHLRLAGRELGEVVLVDEATEVVVARRRLRRGPAPRRRDDGARFVNVLETAYATLAVD